MSTSSQSIKTRIWWDGGEVDFICWTEKSLIFSWRDVTETAVQLPRGAVVRLLEKGVLVVEGEMPSWIYQAIQAFQVQGADEEMLHVAPVLTGPSREPDLRASRPAVRERERVCGDGDDAAPVRFNVVSRLIRKIARLQAE